MMELIIYDLVTDWKLRVDDLQKASIASVARYNKTHYGTGLITTILTGIAGVILLAGGAESWIRNTAGIAGIMAAILSAFETFLSPVRKAEKHHFVIAQLVNVRRDIELFAKYVPDKDTERELRIRDIEDRISNIEQDAVGLEDTKAIRKWPWVLRGFAGAMILVLLLALSGRWINTTLPIFANQQTIEYWVRETVQQGAETWSFDASDPLLKQRTILINTWVNEITTQKVVTLLAYLNELDNAAPISILLTSNGGFSKDAYAITNAIQESEALVNTNAIGDCYSSCAMILMSGTGQRTVVQGARIAIHTHSYPIDGSPSSYYTILYERERDFFQKYAAIPPNWVNREENFFYLLPEEAITYQIVDAIVE